MTGIKFAVPFHEVSDLPMVGDDFDKILADVVGDR